MPPCDLLAVGNRKPKKGLDTKPGFLYTVLPMLATEATTGLEVLEATVNPRHYLEVYFEACAKNGGRPPETIDAYLPWALCEEVRRAIERKAQAERAEKPP